MRKPSLVFFALFVSILICESAMAQSTIMNIPSTDVVAAKKVYVEMDFLTNYAWQRQESFQNYIPRVVVGIARNVEAGVNVSFTHIDGEPGQPIEIQPNIKWQFYSNESNGAAASVGCILYAPMNHRAGTDTHGFCYVNGSKKFSGRLGPRFTGGGYMGMDVQMAHPVLASDSGADNFYLGTYVADNGGGGGGTGQGAPLPAAAWGGLAMIVGLGVSRMVSRKRAAL